MARESTGIKNINPTFYFILITFISISWMAPAVQAGPCENAAQQLRGGFEITQGRGGIWGFMEKNHTLKNDSMIGFQIDGKLQRLVVGFETLCENGKMPTQKTFNAISASLDTARNISNQNPKRVAGEKLLVQITALNGLLDKTISSLGM